MVGDQGQGGVAPAPWVPGQLVELNNEDEAAGVGGSFVRGSASFGALRSEFEVRGSLPSSADGLEDMISGRMGYALFANGKYMTDKQYEHRQRYAA